MIADLGKLYNKTAKVKKAKKRYEESDKGKEVKKKYFKSEKGLSAQLRYYFSPKGVQTREEAKKKRQLLVKCAKWLEENPGKSPSDFLEQLGGK